MQYLAGTSGFSYKEWKGNFYPSTLSPDGMLRYYAERLPAVEIDNTFYRLPRADVLAGWAAQVPGPFRFTLKASRKITHFKRLKDTADETAYLVRVAQSLGDRLGALLFQLPPNLKKDRERLARFLDLLPPTVPAAFEFRSSDWFEDDILGLLREHGRALCLVDWDEEQDPVPEGERGIAGPLARTAPWGYLRLRRAAYDDAALRDWSDRITATGWDRAFVFFKHEDAGAAPAMARRFLQLAGVEAALPIPAFPETALPSELPEPVPASPRVSSMTDAAGARRGPRRSPAAAGTRTRSKRA